MDPLPNSHRGPIESYATYRQTHTPIPRTHWIHRGALGERPGEGFPTAKNGDRLSFSELVANFKDNALLGAAQGIQEKCLDALDDFLLVTSFAARQRCICLGWEANDSRGHLTFYRRGFTIPKP